MAKPYCSKQIKEKNKIVKFGSVRISNGASTICKDAESQKIRSLTKRIRRNKVSAK